MGALANLWLAGNVVVEEVLLCSMLGHKQADGFYQVGGRSPCGWWTGPP